MEKQSTKRVARRQLGIKVGDYVFIEPPGEDKNDTDRLFKIAFIKSVENNVMYNYEVTYFNYKHMQYLCEKKYFKKATNFEIIVAKLKGKLYE